MIGPPMNSAAANCHPMSTSRTTPSSRTRFVDANMNTIAATKSAPFWKSDFAIAVAAKEQLDEIMPNPVERATAGARWSPISRCMSSLDTNVCTAPDRVKPRTSAHSVAQNMKNASLTLSTTAISQQREATVLPRNARVTRSRPDQTGDGGGRFVEFVVGGLATGGERFGDAVGQVIVEQLDGDGL